MWWQHILICIEVLSHQTCGLCMHSPCRQVCKVCITLSLMATIPSRYLIIWSFVPSHSIFRPQIEVFGHQISSVVFRSFGHLTSPVCIPVIWSSSFSFECLESVCMYDDRTRCTEWGPLHKSNDTKPPIWPYNDM